MTRGDWSEGRSDDDRFEEWEGRKGGERVVRVR